MAKKIDLSKTVYELTKEYPELVDIMADLGFTEVKKKAMLNSVGKMMTLPKGAKMKKISMEKIIKTLMEQGFELEGPIPEIAKNKKVKKTNRVVNNSDSRTEQLKKYLKRLADGEDLESVRADFAKNFRDVEAAEIMKAEQELMEEGTPLEEVQKLCDIHSALFHGATREEKIANAEKAVEESLMREKAAAEEKLKDSSDNKAYAASLEAIPGHPLYTLTKENEAFTALLSQFRKDRDESLFPEIREISIHYAKKGDLLYPHLKVKYDVSGPSDVMWTVDDEIRDELGDLEKEGEHDKDWHQRLDAVLKRAEEMVYKEQNILFPICAEKFTEEEWFQIYRDSKDYPVCFGIENEEWKAAESATPEKQAPVDGEIVLPGGHLTVEQLRALLNTIPMEISFVDADNINQFFNEGPKVFKRPEMALGREVFSCHPPKIEPLVRSIIDDFRNGRRDNVPVWMEKNGRTMLVNYVAVRDEDENYIGTVELVQDMEFAKEHFCG